MFHITYEIPQSAVQYITSTSSLLHHNQWTVDGNAAAKFETRAETTKLVSRMRAIADFETRKFFHVRKVR